MLSIPNFTGRSLYAVKNIVYEPSGSYITAEASTLGFPPGEWPEFLAIMETQHDGFLCSRGTPVKDPNGDVLYTPYFTKDAKLPEVRVYND